MLEVLDVASYFCPSETSCIYEVDGVPIYHDMHHLNVVGIELIRPVFRTAFRLTT
jgi:hypothetical protein